MQELLISHSFIVDTIGAFYTSLILQVDGFRSIQLLTSTRMNTPTPNFVSRIANSSQTVSSIEEHNVVSSAANLRSIHGVLFAPSISTNRGSISTVNNELHPHLADSSLATDPPSCVGGAAEITSHESSPPSSVEYDTKGLSSALEASDRNESSHARRVDSLDTMEIGGALATAEKIGFVRDLSRWMEERLGSSVVSQWGRAPGTKGVANLWNELTLGESSLEDSRPPKRTTNVACVKIKNEKGEVLVEAYQEMSDGRRRERNQPLSEKMKPGETVEDACLRGIFEELGAELGSREKVVMVPESYKRQEEERDSFSYPGLRTRFIIHTMEAHVPQLPSSNFSTDEEESDQVRDGDDFAPQRAVGVKRHFWKWVQESELK